MSESGYGLAKGIASGQVASSQVASAHVASGQVASGELAPERLARGRAALEDAGPGYVANEDIGALTASIMRRQLREALRTLAVIAAVFACIPALLTMIPPGSKATWAILGLGVQPVWVAVAVWHVRRAEREERVPKGVGQDSGPGPGAGVSRDPVQEAARGAGRGIAQGSGLASGQRPGRGAAGPGAGRGIVRESRRGPGESWSGREG
ncbi:hypothetical protein Aph01nite_13800 [Acrocarpospora phusangensis]|uniref:Uncharacterized protein n=2 Tax=Acrocarpospora phusangensis TaxID=1070424 RepID=A0A919Q9A5_9ACTN|nr:hypothetical protein Aph01nite_13800 [Acrocarpospora phusangensis]